MLESLNLPATKKIDINYSVAVKWPSFLSQTVGSPVFVPRFSVANDENAVSSENQHH